MVRLGLRVAKECDHVDIALSWKAKEGIMTMKTPLSIHRQAEGTHVIDFGDFRKAPNAYKQSERHAEDLFPTSDDRVACHCQPQIMAI